VLRRLGGETVSAATQIGVGVGVLGVALLMLPGGRVGTAPIAGVLLVAAAALAWATGSYSQARLPLPADPFVGADVQLLAGGFGASGIAVLSGDWSSFALADVTAASVAGLAYLMVVGSAALVTFTWLLRHAPVSKVATHAYVNPVVAVGLGSLLLGETLTPQALAAATVIVTSVAIVIRCERPAPAVPPRLRPIPSAARS
jgi:drug/metabolite transporter (DMT)-like permease